MLHFLFAKVLTAALSCAIIKSVTNERQKGWIFMSYAICHIQKIKGSGNITGMQIHNRRERDHSNSNPDIDFSRSQDNYSLCRNAAGKSFNEYIDQQIKARYKGKKAIRKDAVKMVSVLFTSDELFFYTLSEQREREFFQDCYQWACDRWGKENIICAEVHKDEKTPHMHLGFVPLTEDGRLSAKSCVGDGGKALQKLQDDFYKAIGRKWGLDRGTRHDLNDPTDRPRGHIDSQEFKDITDYHSRRNEDVALAEAMHRALEDLPVSEPVIPQLQRTSALFGKEKKYTITQSDVDKIDNQQKLITSATAALNENQVLTEQLRQQTQAVEKLKLQQLVFEKRQQSIKSQQQAALKKIETEREQAEKAITAERAESRRVISKEKEQAHQDILDEHKKYEQQHNEEQQAIDAQKVQLQQERKRLEDKYSSESSVIASKNEIIAELTSKLATTSSREENLLSKNLDLRETVDEQKEKIQSLENRLSDINSRKNSLSTENSVLKQDFQHEKEKNKTLALELASVKEKLETITSSNDDLSSKVKSLEEQAQEDASEINRLSLLVDDIQKKFNTACNIIRNMAKAIGTLLYGNYLSKLEYVSKSSKALIDGISNYAADWLNAFNFPDKATDVRENVCISEGIQNHINELDPPVQSRDRSH